VSGAVGNWDTLPRAMREFQQVICKALLRALRRETNRRLCELFYTPLMRAREPRCCSTTLYVIYTALQRQARKLRCRSSAQVPGIKRSLRTWEPR
jgi:hypothetical protein